MTMLVLWLRYRVAIVLDFTDDRVLGHPWYRLCEFIANLWPDSYASQEADD